MAVQEEHDLLDLLLLVPGAGDHGDALGADIRHLPQALGVVLDDVQGAYAKAGDDALRQARADAAHQPGAQVAADAGGGGGQGLLANLDLELLPVLGVVDSSARCRRRCSPARARAGCR